ncbi:hypothetical protein L1887_62742 [Cichorium endivia]|nr:hypothetical protein L1887_62742 [Cichorium endivia]
MSTMVKQALNVCVCVCVIVCTAGVTVSVASRVESKQRAKVRTRVRGAWCGEDDEGGAAAMAGVRRWLPCGAIAVLLRCGRGARTEADRRCARVAACMRAGVRCVKSRAAVHSALPPAVPPAEQRDSPLARLSVGSPLHHCNSPSALRRKE